MARKRTRGKKSSTCPGIDGRRAAAHLLDHDEDRAPAFWKLIDRHAWLGRKHPGQYPIVEIQSSGYEDKRYGWIDTPAFKIVGWAGRPDLQQLGGSNGDGDDAAEAADQHDDMDDEVPF
jgi:hypothetical protein